MFMLQTFILRESSVGVVSYPQGAKPQADSSSSTLRKPATAGPLQHSIVHGMKGGYSNQLSAAQANNQKIVSHL